MNDVATSETVHEQKAHDSADQGHTEGQQHPLGIYLWIWALLFVFSTFSYLVDYFQLHGLLRWSLIILFMLVKAGLIVAIFMHMRWERPRAEVRHPDPAAGPPHSDRPDGDRRSAYLHYPLGGRSSGERRADHRLAVRRDRCRGIRRDDRFHRHVSQVAPRLPAGIQFRPSDRDSLGAYSDRDRIGHRHTGHEDDRREDRLGSESRSSLEQEIMIENQCREQQHQIGDGESEGAHRQLGSQSPA